MMHHDLLEHPLKETEPTVGRGEDHEGIAKLSILRG
jgi:hypothetical protein